MSPKMGDVSSSQVGEVQASPTSYTVLARLKELLTGVILAAGSAVVGWFKLKRVPVITSTTGNATAVATLNPQAAFQLLEVRFHLASALAAGETLSIKLDANDGVEYDVVLLSLVLGTTILDVVVEFGGDSYFFESGDQIVIALSANTGSDVWGCQTVHELV